MKVEINGNVTVVKDGNRVIKIKIGDRIVKGKP